MSTKITSPIEGFDGRTVFGPLAVEFKDGVAETDEKVAPGLKSYLERRGYKVQGVKKAPAKETTPATFNPGDATVEEVVEYLAGFDDGDPEKHDAEVARVLEAERAGKNRSTLIEAIEGTPAGQGD